MIFQRIILDLHRVREKVGLGACFEVGPVGVFFHGDDRMLGGGKGRLVLRMQLLQLFEGRLRRCCLLLLLWLLQIRKRELLL